MGRVGERVVRWASHDVGRGVSHAATRRATGMSGPNDSLLTRG